MKIAGNIIWVIFGGLGICLGYIASGLLFCISIIGIPFGIQLFKLAIVALWPFGTKISDGDGSTGCLPLFMNIIWILIGGFWICLSHVGLGILFCITIIGIPFGKQHFKMAALALTPFGKNIS